MSVDYNCTCADVVWLLDPTRFACHWLMLIGYQKNNVCRYVSSVTHLSFSWSGFKFTLPVKMYYWGIGTSQATLTSLSC